MDGRKIYGPFDVTGSLAWGLDECNGRWEMAGQNDGTLFGADVRRPGMSYTYRATPNFPYVIGCFGPAGSSTPAAEDAEAQGIPESDEDVFEEDEDGRCPPGSFLSIETRTCKACHPGTYGKDAGLDGWGCPGVSDNAINGRSLRRD